MATATRLLHRQPAATAAEDLAARLLELAGIRSVSREERALCDRIENRLRSVAGVEVGRTGDNLIATLPELSGRPRLILCGHLDTVPENQNFPPRREADRIDGLGTTDLKSGLAVLLRLLDELSGAVVARALERVDCDPAFVFYAREEIAFSESGLNEVERDWPKLKEAAFAVCVEPTANAVELGCNGTMHAELALLGKAAHAARPWLGSNAIHSALPLLSRVASRPERTWSPPGRPEIQYREVMSVTGVQGGKARNVVPDRCTFNVNFRFAPDRTPENARAEIRSLFQDALDAGKAELFFRDVAPAGRVPAGNRWCDRLVALAKNEVRAKQAWTDVGRFSEWKIDAVSCGPGFPEVAHQREEWASVAKMVESLAIFRGLVGLGEAAAPEGAAPTAPKGAGSSS
jgi:succinyl-diaminopimelate desuccinylase